jgi:putative oxidoreductase
MRPFMPAFVTFGRILFAVLFIYTGATKLFTIQATADFIATKVVVPEAIESYTKQIETATAMTTPQLLAIAGGGLEIIAGLMIALNFGARFFALLMIIYIAVSTVLFSDFWNQAAPDNARMVVDALKNLSIIGALFMIMGYGRATRSAETAYGDV